MRYQTLTGELIEEILTASLEDQSDWLILTESEEFPGYWTVEGLDAEFFYDFEEMLGAYRIIAPARIDEFLKYADSKGYKVVFTVDPERILTVFDDFRKDPLVSLHSTMENTVQGMLPWQIIGFNKLIRSDIPAGLAIWDTGAGKTALLASALRWHLDENHIDLGLVVVKAHNKYDTQAKLKSFADIDSVVIDGDYTVKRKVKGKDELVPGPRMKAYEEVEAKLKAKEPVVMVTNYEKFRDDAGIIDHFIGGRRVFFCWDEMPTKLSSRKTQLYEAIKRALYVSFVSKPRPSWMRHLVLTATPIENDPDGLFSCLNLVRPRYLGTVNEFHSEHVLSRNYFSRDPETWTGLDKIEAQIEHMTHRVSTADPDVAKMFPGPIYLPRIIDWTPKYQSVYDRFIQAAEQILEEEDSGVIILSLIQVMQMLCDAPSMIKHSAANREEFTRELLEGSDADPRGSEAALRLAATVKAKDLTDTGHPKLEAWREIIQEKHPTSKIVTHSTWASYIFPVWQHWLDEWGVSYVTFAGTDKQKQDALDAFRDDPSIRVFLSGDAGADSIDIPQAQVGVSYNGAWKWTTMKQRRGRYNRVNSSFDVTYTYDLAMANSVEDRKREIRDRKYAYHAALFEGRALESALSSRMTADDLRYMLLGEPLDE
jgi:SNF2 family DNA or RNA helicase